MSKGYYLLLNRITYGNPQKCHKILASYASLSAFQQHLSEAIIRYPWLTPYQEKIKNHQAETVMAHYHKKNIQILSIDDPEYPKQLKEIYDPPLLLFYKGNLEILNTAQLAIVGPRKPTHYGTQVAKELAQQVTRYFTITSGLAAGIDTIAHKTALEMQQPTVAVLGSSFDQLYPKSNLDLAEEITKTGIIITEFPENTPALKHHFPQRNRIVSGLSKGVLVCEATNKSGSLITARLAMEQNREVFAVPGPIHSELSEGVHNLIKDGAKLTQSMQDILDELTGNTKIKEKTTPKTSTLPPETLTAPEKNILNLITEHPIHIDLILKKSNTSLHQILQTLTYFEIEGWIKQLPGKQFIKTL